MDDSYQRFIGQYHRRGANQLSFMSGLMYSVFSWHGTVGKSKVCTRESRLDTIAIVSL